MDANYEERMAALASWTGRMRERGDPKSLQMAHDADYLYPFVDRFFAGYEERPDQWHNPVVMTMMAGESESIFGLMVMQMATGNFENAKHILEMRLHDAFCAGFEAGEGPEHIYKCTSTHGVGDEEH